MKKILIILLIIFCSKIGAQQTDYSQIPKSINKQIQKFYKRNNVFYFYFPELKNSFALWNYEDGKVNWLSIENNKILKSGEFNSEIKSDSLSVNATYKVLKNEIEIMLKDSNCSNVLDGSFLGYVYTIKNEEIIGLNSIATYTCIKNQNSIITKDFNKIFNLIYKTSDK